MKIRGLDMLTDIGRKYREVLRRTWPGLRHGDGVPAPGQFQPYSHTLPGRYPWLFEFAAARLGDAPGRRIMSFGCSRGDEVLTLRKYFPSAAIRGIDIDARNIERCLARARAEEWPGVSFAVAATTESERAESYDAIFCLAVLCHGDLTAGGAQRCDPLLHFDDFQRMVADFARCLKPRGLLLLQTTNFRFCDTATAQDFDAVLDAKPEQLAADVLFDRDNTLMKDVRYSSVAFCKHAPAARRAAHDAAAH
jgi:2-polyprenyl-3-methyl-5-hydroxy-6-metoxy-1,4-benzoquinol methylase